MSRGDDERVADILDAASEIGEVIELGQKLGRAAGSGAPPGDLIIGEAANTLSEEYRAQRPGIPRRDIIGLRVVLSHYYLRVDPCSGVGNRRHRGPRQVQELRPER